MNIGNIYFDLKQLDVAEEKYNEAITEAKSMVIEQSKLKFLTILVF
jgi:hypothetical protein